MNDDLRDDIRDLHDDLARALAGSRDAIREGDLAWWINETRILWRLAGTLMDLAWEFEDDEDAPVVAVFSDL